MMAGTRKIKTAKGRADYQRRVAEQTTGQRWYRAGKGWTSDPDQADRTPVWADADNHGITPDWTEFHYHGRGTRPTDTPVLATLTRTGMDYTVTDTTTGDTVTTFGPKTRFWADTTPTSTTSNEERTTMTTTTTTKTRKTAQPAKADVQIPSAVERVDDGEWEITSKHGVWTVTADHTGHTFYLEGPNHHLGEVWIDGTLEDVEAYVLGSPTYRREFHEANDQD
jgi:hypothetical protein